MGSSSFYVDDHHRGHGGRIFFSIAASPGDGLCSELQPTLRQQLCGRRQAQVQCRIPMANYSPSYAGRQWSKSLFIAEVRIACSPVCRGPNLPACGSVRPLQIDAVPPEALQPLTSAEQVNDLRVHHPSVEIDSMRDLAYIRWRYFSRRDATTAAFAFRSRQS